MRREKKRKEIYCKLRMKYEKFRRKYREAARRFCKGGDAPALREELRKKYEELLAFGERFSTLDGTLVRIEEELELNIGLE